jgi:cytosine/uracil/thiamine/allantoin permease
VTPVWTPRVAAARGTGSSRWGRPGYPFGCPVVHNVPVTSGRQGSGQTISHARVLALAAGVTATVVAWGVLVFAAIDFGRSARDGQSGDWVFLTLATLGAVACMFLAIVLASKMQTLMQGDPTRPHPEMQEQPRPKGASAGGKRAAR